MTSLLESLQKTLSESTNTHTLKPAVYPETPSESIVIMDTTDHNSDLGRIDLDITNIAI